MAPPALLPLPHLSHLVLLALARGDAHGWEIIRRIRDIEETNRTPSSGSLYTAMLRLEESGLIAEVEPPADGEEGDARRRYYALTTSGRKLLAAETARLARLVERAREWNVLDRPARGRA